MTNKPDLSPLDKAEKFIRGKNFPAALDILGPYVKVNPRSEKAWFLLSYAVNNLEKKLECIEKVLSINPDNRRAQERLLMIRSRSPSSFDQETLQPNLNLEPEKPLEKKRISWAAIPIAILLIVLIAYISWKEIIPSFSSESTQSVVIIETGDTIQIVSLTPSTTPSPEPTLTILPPTFTPTKVLSPTPTSTPTEIPHTPTPDFPLLDEQLGQLFDDLQNQTSTIRGLPILVDNPRYFIPQSEVRNIVSNYFLERYSQDEIADRAIFLNALGLLNPGYDLYSNMLTSLDEGLGGFYIPWTNELFVIGDEFSSLQEPIYVHEYDHALVDQHFSLEEIGFYPECVHEFDICVAFSALVEGDATLLMEQWLESYADEDTISEIQKSKFTPAEKVISSKEITPPYLIRQTYFNYVDGKNFVSLLFDQGGWDTVNRVYQVLPESSEQILHPEKYLEREVPVQIDLIPLDDILDDEWRFIAADTLGELTTEMILDSNANYLVQLDPVTAVKAAAGWGGDSYQLFFRNKTYQSILVVNWIWDTWDDREEFLDAMDTYLNKRYLGHKLSASDYNCWEKTNEQVSCLLRYKVNTLWVTAPTIGEIYQIVEKYPRFR